ncbi:MAG TPA: radical SAM protein, partial [Vicinamibacteria bacterium]|nr:radical SAM protein [Vicinamibacteria bacterium]
MRRSPAWKGLVRSGELGRRAAAARGHLHACDLCGRRCGSDRLAGTLLGACRTGERAVVASWGPHHGEEAPVSGTRGSGTVFFSFCNLACEFCQNADVSRLGEGREATPMALAAIFLALQDEGCHNLNLVSPTHVLPQVLEALPLAAASGFSLPLVWNTGGYDSLEALLLLDGVVDVYMPDMKYGDAGIARAFSGVEDYPAVNRAAVKEMHRQVGDLLLDEEGVAVRGLLVRHLVLPGGLAGSEEVFRFLATEVSAGTYLNVMAQYRPAYRARLHPPLDRTPTEEELAAAFALAARHGL